MQVATVVDVLLTLNLVLLKATALKILYDYLNIYNPNFMKKLFINYGIFIPLLLTVVFSITDLLDSGTTGWPHTILANLLIYGVGAQTLGFAFVHLFHGETIAQYIGWPSGNPFQNEVGIANFGIGTLGILCGWFDNEFWLATIIMFSLFMGGCAIGHIRDRLTNKNKEKGNAGLVFYWDCFMPFILVLFWILDKP